MEGLLPLLIMIVLSIVFSSKKKKRRNPPPREYNEPTASDSPWDDLMRELRKSQEPDRAPETYGAPEPAEVVEEPVFRMGPSIPAPSSDPLPVPEPASVSPYFSYDDEESLESPEERYFSYDAYEEQVVEDTIVHAQAVSSLAAPEEEPEPASASEQEEGGTFAGGFDPRMAVLYSEVFRPKYLER